MENNLYLIPIAMILIFRFFKYIYDNKISKEADEKMNQNRKNEIKKLIKNREERTNDNIFEEKVFWEIIETISLKSKNSYKNFIGLLKDKLVTINSEELIEIDNLILDMYKKYLTKEIIGASQIIFKSTDIHFTFLLMNYLISKNQVIFKNTCLNIELIDKIKIENLIPITINDLIEDCYLILNNKLIPKSDVKKNYFENIEKLYSEKELPDVFPKLWMEFA